MTNHLDDPFIQELLFKFGAPGYLAYFGTVSLICKENKAYQLTGKAAFSSRFLKQKLHISPAKLQAIYTFCQTEEELFFNFHEKIFEFDFPKVMEIKDNHSTNLQAAGKQPSLEVEVDKEVDKEKETSSAHKLFLNLWNTLPPDMKKGKERAWDSFKNQVGNEKDLTDIQTALKNYCDQIIFIRANGFPERQYQHGSTWFNSNWKDYINIEPNTKPTKPRKASPMEQADKGVGPFVDKIKGLWSELEAKHPESPPDFISKAIVQVIPGTDMSAALRVIKTLQKLKAHE